MPTVDEVLTTMAANFNANAAKGMKAVYQFDLTGENARKHHFLIDDGKLESKAGAHEKPNITITMAGNDFVDMTTGKLNPQMAFMSGKLKIAGDMGLAMKLQQVFPQQKA
jgi:putative sterol carrier protein